MLVDRFRKLAAEFQERETALLDHKRDEYASQEADVLENFTTLGLLLRRRPEQVAATLLAKHVQAILKQVEDDAYAWAWETPKGEGLKQRISDARNYLLLLAACIDERKVPVERGPRTPEEIAREISTYIGHDHGYSSARVMLREAQDGE